MIRSFGEHALLVEVDGWEAAQALATSIVSDPLPGVEAAIPGRRSVLVELDRAEADRVGEIVAALGSRLRTRIEVPAGRLHTIPLVYGGRDGPDLAEVAAACGITADEYAARHASALLRVMFCGFAPGFAYLGDLPEELRVARLATPRTRVPAGSVAVAGDMTGIYPAELPGGWRIIGRTTVVLFDPHRNPPTLLAPGDAVRFKALRAASI